MNGVCLIRYADFPVGMPVGKPAYPVENRCTQCNLFAKRLIPFRNGLCASVCRGRRSPNSRDMTKP